ncbi:MAG: hypothetical protein F6J96_08255 [Symploca sp. SIO1C2]|nr:hypothetical protein [Symploca sp. SIO1C2]
MSHPEGRYELYRHCAELLERSDQIDEAADLLREGISSIAHYESRSKLYLACGMLLKRHNRIDEAIALLRQGIDHIPSEYGVERLYTSCSDLLTQANRTDEAITLLRQGIDLIPLEHNVSTLYTSCGNLLAQVNRTDEAITLLRQGIDLILPEHNVSTLYTSCGNLLAQVNRTDEAITLLRQGIDLILPEHNVSTLYTSCGNLLAQVNRTDEAITLLRQGIDLILPEHSVSTLYTSCGNLLAQANRTDEAIEFLRQGIERIPPEKNIFSLYQCVNKILVRDGRIAEASQFLKDGLQKIPVNQQYKLAETLIWMNAATQNQAELEKILAGTGAIQLSPSMLVRGQILLAQLQENWQRAAEIASEGMTQIPNYLTLRSQAAFSWLSAGDPKTAQQIIQDYPLKPVEGNPILWLKALIDLKNNDIDTAATSLETYLGRLIQVETELTETFLLSLWNTPGSLEGKTDLAFYFPTLPPSITGFDIPITRISFSTSEFIDNLIAKRHKEQTKVYGNTQEQTSLSVGLRYVLHLSDLHIIKPDQAILWSHQLAQDLYNELDIPQLDALIISGDIANHSTPEEYQAAEQFLHNLRQDFPLEPEQIIIVPGNHDLNWQQAKKAYKLVDLEDYEGELKEGHYIEVDDTVIRVRDETSYKQRFVNFSNFYQAIAGRPYPQEYDEQGILYHLRQQNLLFLGLNSAWQLDHHYTSRASINMNALSKALTEIRRNPDYENCLKIAVWHHPVVSTHDDKITDSAFLDQLAVAGFRLFLHGHIHKAKTSNYRYDMSQDGDGRKLDQICAGTFGAPTQELFTATPWQYNLLQFETNKLTVRTRRRSEENGAWEADSIWRQGAGQSSVDRYTIEL